MRISSCFISICRGLRIKKKLEAVYKNMKKTNKRSRQIEPCFNRKTNEYFVTENVWGKIKNDLIQNDKNKLIFRD